MQSSSSSSSHRPSRRRSPASDSLPNPSSAASTPNPPPPPPPPPPSSSSAPQMAAVQSSASATRSSSGSAKTSSSGKKKDQLSQIEKSVTHLLIATKQLLETLTQWSRHNASEGEVSDVYVRLGYEFNIACRAFTSIGVDTTDLGPVPDMLRLILEETLSQEASPASLDRFLPRIRDIIINLLHGLKRKQQRLRARQAKEAGGGPAPGQASRQLSSGSIGSYDTGPPGSAASNGITNSLSQMLDEGSSLTATTTTTSTPGPANMPSQDRPASKHRSERRNASGSTNASDEFGIPARSSSAQTPSSTGSIGAQRPSGLRGGVSDAQRSDGSPNRTSLRERRNPPPPSLSDSSSMSSITMQNIPVMSPDESRLPIQKMPSIEEPGPPPPPPKQQDALAALQRGGELERRASRRYSAYQISKHLGASPSGVPMIPPAQNSPIPNRGRDARESLTAVRTRSSLLPSRQRSTRFAPDSSPSRGTTVPSRISEERSSREGSEKPQTPTGDSRELDSPTTKTPEDKLGPTYFDRVSNREEPVVRATVNGPLMDSPMLPTFAPSSRGGKSAVTSPIEQADVPNSKAAFVPEDSPQPGKELTLFLQYKSKIKKFVLPDGSNDLSMARLQLAFIEKFAWNTHSNGNDLPEIYIQDPVSGVRHELEDLADIKDRSVLVLNVEVLDEVKRHIDEGLGGLRKVVEGVRTAVEGQQAVMGQFTEQQQGAVKEMARLAASTTTNNTNQAASSQAQVNGAAVAQNGGLEEVQTLRRDLAVIRQTFTAFTTNITSSMAAIRAKAETVKAQAVDVSIPVLEGDSGRAYVNEGKKRVGDESEQVVNLVDDLQDIVEDLRKDVVTRGVRPLPRQLEQVGKDISAATKEVKKMQEYVRREKPIWTKIWEKELETVCNEREFLTMQEDLVADLEDDLEKAAQTFGLVEQATKQQNLVAGGGSGGGSSGGNPVMLRSAASRGVAAYLDSAIDPTMDPMRAKDGVLGEVRALQPNHESRLEAIERAERARQRELDSRGREGAAFKKELNAFVEEGKLKKSGGIEEAERLRRAKDEKSMRDDFAGQQARKEARARAREEKKKQAEMAQQTATTTTTTTTTSHGEGEGEGDGDGGADNQGHEGEDDVRGDGETTSRVEGEDRAARDDGYGGVDGEDDRVGGAGGGEEEQGDGGIEDAGESGEGLQNGTAPENRKKHSVSPSPSAGAGGRNSASPGREEPGSKLMASPSKRSSWLPAIFTS